MSAALPLDVVTVGEFEIRIVHEARGRQRLAAPLVKQLAMRHLSQLLVHDRQQALERTALAGSMGLEQRCDLRIRA